MECKDFREQIAERLAGELPAEQERDFDAHAHTCKSCQDSLRDWEETETLLRAAWPSEDAPLPRLSLPPRVSRSWLDTAGAWFARVSMAAVMGCLLALIVLRPAIQLDRQGLRVSVGRAGVQPGTASAAPVSEAQVRDWVGAAVQKAVAEEESRLQASSATRAIGSSDEARRWVEMSAHLRMVEQAQAYLWQQLQQQGLYLESAWRNSAEPLGPAENLHHRRK